MCGENRAPAFSGDSFQGSPPRVRGKQARDQVRAAHLRITPACAGKTRSTQAMWRGRGDHPRVCGENLDGLREQAEAEGSPPRVRGKRRPTP